MPITRDTDKSQHDLTDFHYGELPVEGLPTGNQIGDLLVWDGVQWRFGQLAGGAGIRVDWNAGTSRLEISLDALRSEDTFTGDGVLLRIEEDNFTGDAVVQGTEEDGITADAVLA